MKNSRCRSGFTFLEIMMVVVIIGMLAALVGPRIAGRAQQARVNTAKTQLTSLENALKQYEMDMGSYPSQTDGLQALVQRPTGDDAEAWNGPYLAKNELPKDPWGREFQYKFPGEHNSDDYDIWSAGPDKQQGSKDDIANWTKRD